VLNIAPQFASFLNSLSQYKTAEELDHPVFEGSGALLGKEHSHALKSMKNRAFLLKRQGKYDEAEPIYRQTLALCKTNLDREHLNTLAGMNNLACLLDC